MYPEVDQVRNRKDHLARMLISGGRFGRLLHRIFPPGGWHRACTLLWKRWILFFLIGWAPVASLPGQSAPAQETGKYLDQMTQAYAGVRDYTCIFTKQERVKGNLLPRETIRLKFQKPFSVYMKWITEPHLGQEILYKRGWNNDKMLGHPGSFPDITLSLNPHGRLAMRDNRHPVTEAGIGHTIAIVTRDYRRAIAHPADSVRYVDRGIVRVEGERSRCFEAIVPVAHAADYYSHRAELCINLQTHLPNQLKIRDAENRLIEFYQYLDLKTNVGLTGEDFNPENPEYDF